MPSGCRTELVRTAEAFDALAPEWWELWRRDTAATPFQSPAWLLPWWHHFDEGELLAIVVRDAGGRLIGLLPLYIYPDPQSSRRKLLFVGAGTSDYQGGVFDPTTAETAVIAALDRLATMRDAWDETYLAHLPPESHLLRVARRLGAPIFSSEPCSKMHLPQDGVLHGKLRGNLNYYRNRAERSYELRFVTATPETALIFFDRLIALHAKRWQSRGEPGVLEDPRVLAANRESIPLLLDAELLRMHALLLDDEMVAVLYGLADGPHRPERKVYYYLNGFDPDYGPFSPGTLLLGFAVERAVARGASWLDMLRGDEPYKRLWGPEVEPTYGVVLPTAAASPTEESDAMLVHMAGGEQQR